MAKTLQAWINGFPVQKFYTLFLPTLLCSILLAIVIANFSNTWLTGWDTLHPEFNYTLNLKRMMFGSWREDQGLGTVPAHSHMSELPRILTLALFDVFLPTHLVKQIYILLCFILGPLGVYALVANGILRKEQERIKISAAFIASLVYTLNLATVQHFYVVFEMFAVQYAAIGWLFFLVLRYLDTGKKRFFVFFILFSFLAAPMAYASLLWFAYFGGLILFIGSYTLLNRNWSHFRRSFFILVSTIGTNAFWLLPNIYFLLSGAAKVPQQAHINELFSPEAFLHNTAYGSIPNFAILKNFLFNWVTFDFSSSTFQPLLNNWENHLKVPLVLPIGYSVFVLSIIGMVVAIYHKSKSVIALIPALLLSAIMLINQNPPFTALFVWLRNKSDFFEEGLRFPFTKFSILYMLVFAVLVGLSVKTFAKIKNRLVVPSFTLTFSLLLIYYCWPMFTGNLIAKQMKTEIPDSYMQFFEYAQSLPDSSRIAQLPLNTLQGWSYNTWGYEGPGFLWFGVNQPLLVRDFDRWSIGNETFYTLFSSALYGNDISAINSTLMQFDVSYLLFDTSITTPLQSEKAISNTQIIERIQSSGAKLIWETEQLKLFSFPNVNTQTFVQAPNTYDFVSIDHNYSRYSPLLLRNTLQDKEYESVAYPFSNLAKNRDVSSFISADPNTVSVRSKVEILQPSTLSFPTLNQQSIFAPLANIRYDGGTLSIVFQPPVTLKLSSQETDAEYQPFPEFEINPIKLAIQPEELGLSIGNQLITLKSGAEKTVQLTGLHVLEALQIDYFDSRGITTEGKVTTIPSDEVFTIESDFFWDVYSKPFSMNVEPGTYNFELKISSGYTAITDRLKSASYSSCDSLNRGEIFVNLEQFTYQAKNKGAVCHGIELPELNTQLSHLIHVSGINESGRSFKLYSTNASSSRTDIEQLLGSQSFDHWFSLISWQHIQPSSQILSLETRSFGNETSSNKLEQIESYTLPISIQDITAINIVPKNYTTFSNPLVLKTIKKHNPTVYTVSTKIHENSDTDPGLITLSQGYDKGWVAYYFDYPLTKLSLLNQYIPELTGKKMSHVLSNGWANGWLIDPPPVNPDATIIIMYWPQRLQFIGYVSLLFTLVAACFALRKRS